MGESLNAKEFFDISYYDASNIFECLSIPDLLNVRRDNR